MTLKTGDRRHGTWQGYTDHRCRCHCCEAAIHGRHALPCPHCQTGLQEQLGLEEATG